MSKRLVITSSTLRGTPLPEKEALVDDFIEKSLPLFDSAKLQPVIDRVFPLAQAEDAHAYMATNANFGKIVLRVE
jgi:NADPH2:quinone reductase